MSEPDLREEREERTVWRLGGSLDVSIVVSFQCGKSVVVVVEVVLLAGVVADKVVYLERWLGATGERKAFVMDAVPSWPPLLRRAVSRRKAEGVGRNIVWLLFT